MILDQSFLYNLWYQQSRFDDNGVRFVYLLHILPFILKSFSFSFSFQANKRNMSVQQGDFYGSDCTNVYDVGSGGGYASQSTACQACTTSTQDIINNGYFYSGQCQGAPTTPDPQGALRYISDGTSYFSASNGMLDDHSLPSNACATPHNPITSASSNAFIVGQCAMTDVSQSTCNCAPTNAQSCSSVGVCQSQSQFNALASPDQALATMRTQAQNAAASDIAGGLNSSYSSEYFTIFENKTTDTIAIVLVVAVLVVIVLLVLKHKNEHPLY